MSAFDKIKLGLEEAIAYEKGTLPAKTTRLTIVPVETYQADEIKRIRNSTGLTQRSFAEYRRKRLKHGKQGETIRKVRHADYWH